MVNGKKELVGSGVPDGTNFFGFVFIPEYEGFYVIGDERYNQWPVYLKPGDRAAIYIGANTVRLDGKANSKEMQVLYDWQALSYRVDRNARDFGISNWTFEEFFPAFEAFLPLADQFKKRIKTSNSTFNELMVRYVDYSKDWFVLAFGSTPRKKHPRKEERMPYYATIIDPEKFTDDVVLQMPWGFNLLDRYTQFVGNENGTKYTDIPAVLACIPNMRLQGELVLQRMGIFVKTYPAYQRMMERFGVNLNADQKIRAEAMGSKLYEGRAGLPAPEFTYPDITGKSVSLSDFKGKVVLIDVWATWCGPCKGELPHLKKLEETFEGKDVVFVSISLDEPKNKEKWEAMVRDEQLGGVQLYGGGGSTKIAQDFKINAIPRFILIDKKGNVVNATAPRPSEPLLSKLIEIELRK